MPSSHITWHSDIATATGARVPEGIMAIVAASGIRLCNHMLIKPSNPKATALLGCCAA